MKPGGVKMSFSDLVLLSFRSSSSLLSDITVWHLVKNFLPFPLLTNLRCVITELLISRKGALWFGHARPPSFISTSHNLIYPRTHRREEANKRQRVNFTLELDLSVSRACAALRSMSSEANGGNGSICLKSQGSISCPSFGNAWQKKMCRAGKCQQALSVCLRGRLWVCFHHRQDQQGD